jgi:hypothetical protein
MERSDSGRVSGEADLKLTVVPLASTLRTISLVFPSQKITNLLRRAPRKGPSESKPVLH